MKKILAEILTICLMIGLLEGCGKQEKAQVEGIRVGALLGPTAMGMVGLMEASEQGETENQYTFAELSADPAAFVAPLVSGEMDIAAVPSNLASVIYHNSEGKVKVLAITVNCVLAIVERGETVQSLADLKGKTIYATGQGAVPEYTLATLLSRIGLQAEQDIEIRWCSDTTEALSYVSEDETAIAMLPQPFVTIAMSKVEDLRLALDLNDVWKELVPECEQVTGVLVAGKDFAEQNPKALEQFMKEYEASAMLAINDPEHAAALIEQYGIVPKAPLAQKALPGCHIAFKTGAQMRADLEAFYELLAEQNPKAIGGSVPGADFYY